MDEMSLADFGVELASDASGHYFTCSTHPDASYGWDNATDAAVEALQHIRNEHL